MLNKDGITLLFMLKLELTSKSTLQLTRVFIKVAWFFFWLVGCFKDFICLNLLIIPQFRFYLRVFLLH